MSELHPNNETYVNQQELLERLLQPQPTVIAIEGGPCGGKSTLLAEIERQAEGVNRQVVIIPEVATPHIEELKRAGFTVPELAQNNRPGFLEFQQNILAGIIAEIEAKKDEYKDTDAIIVMDRCDIGAYVTPEENKLILRNLERVISPLHEHVDKIYYLPSVAREDPEKYDRLKHTNTGRYEEAGAAIATCEANLWAVSAHPELHISWGGEFAEKMRRVAQSILQPELEWEIKQSVSHPDAINILEVSEILCMHGIYQSYHELQGQEFRLRKQQSLGARSFFLTIKRGEGVRRTEVQRRITADEYEMLRQVPRLGNELYKTRYTLLDTPDGDGRRRLWNADTYEQPYIPRWHFETDVETEAEADELDLLYKGIRKRVTTSARDLIYID